MSKQSKCNEWIVDIITNNWTEDVNLALKKINLMGARYKAIAQLATQLENGTNYLILAKQIICQNPVIENKILVTFYASINASDISDIEIHSIQQLPHKCTTITIPKNQKIDISHLIFNVAPQNSKVKNNPKISSEPKTDTNEWEFDPNGWELDFLTKEQPKDIDTAITSLNQKTEVTYKAMTYLGKQDFKDANKGINYAITAEQTKSDQEKNIVLIIFNVQNDNININQNIKILKYNKETNTYDISLEPPSDKYKDIWDKIKPLIEGVIHPKLNSFQFCQNNKNVNNEKPNNWMNKIPDTTPVNKLSIPGTHDTLTWDISLTSPRYWIIAIPIAIPVLGPVLACVVAGVSLFVVGCLAVVVFIATCIVFLILTVLAIILVILYYTRGLKYCQTQNLTFEEQFDCGCRYFDIRIDENLKGCHGKEAFGATCVYDLKKVMESVKNFFNNDENKKEVIIMRIANERGDSTNIDFLNKINNIIKEYKDLFWTRPADPTTPEANKNYWPLMKDVRRKIIILDSLNGHPFSNQKYGFEYPSNIPDYPEENPNRYFYKPQDDYENPDLKVKKGEIEKYIDTSDLDDPNSKKETIKMKINHVSATGIKEDPLHLGWTPGEYAAYLNPKVVDYLKNNPQSTTGLLIFDYFDETIANAVISTNKGKNKQ